MIRVKFTCDECHTSLTPSLPTVYSESGLLKIYVRDFLIEGWKIGIKEDGIRRVLCPDCAEKEKNK